MDTRLEQTVQIKVPPQKVFDFLTSPEKIPLVLPSLVENTNISELPLKKNSTFDWRYQMYGVMLKGTWTVTAIESPSRYEAKTSGDTESKWAWRIDEAGSGSKVHLAVEYATPKSVLGKAGLALVQQLNRKELDSYLSNIKTVLEMQG
jgi:uncharacterized protein YndB with AHSA1/START domain